MSMYDNIDKNEDVPLDFSNMMIIRPKKYPATFSKRSYEPKPDFY